MDKLGHISSSHVLGLPGPNILQYGHSRRDNVQKRQYFSVCEREPLGVDHLGLLRYTLSNKVNLSVELRCSLLKLLMIIWPFVFCKKEDSWTLYPIDVLLIFLMILNHLGYKSSSSEIYNSIFWGLPSVLERRFIEVSKDVDFGSGWHSFDINFRRTFKVTDMQELVLLLYVIFGGLNEGIVKGLHFVSRREIAKVNYEKLFSRYNFIVRFDPPWILLNIIIF